MERVAAGRDLLLLQHTCLQPYNHTVRDRERERAYRGSNCRSRKHRMNTGGCSRSRCDTYPKIIAVVIAANGDSTKY
jgi:hypothetical protein